MLIQIKGANLELVLTGELLKSYNKTQFVFFGFRKNAESDSFLLHSQNPEEDLHRLVEYLEEESLAYSLSPEATYVLAEYRKRLSYFGDLKRHASEFKNGIVDSDKFRSFNDFVQKNIPRKLRQHQIKAAFHLWSIENGANFSVPGSGKTSVVLTVYEKLRFENKVNLLFVVGPASSFGPWKTEFAETLGRIPRYRIFAGGETRQRKEQYYQPPRENFELYLSTFQTVLNDQEELSFFLNQRDVHAFFVVDEAHYIKQLNGLWASAVKSISKHSQRRCVLTGTPMPRSYSDVFNLIDLLWPDYEPIDSEEKIRIVNAEANRDPETARQVLNETISPLFYRVRKQDLGLTTPVFHPPVVIRMNKMERMLYDAIETKIRAYAKKDYLQNIDLVVRLRRGRITRLRQCATYAKLLSSVLEQYDETLIETGSELQHAIEEYDAIEKPAKLSYLATFLEPFRETKQKVVIWANFVGTIELISNHLNSNGFSNKIIYGGTPSEHVTSKEEQSRESIRDEFVDPASGLDLLIANPAACAESISLHKTCHNSVYYDLSYNCAQYLQSLDRIHRVGGSETVVANYYFIQYADTIEQDIKNNLDQKAARMNQVIDVDYSIYSLDMFEEDENELSAYERLFDK
jgi:SNF2 family DNA or RNA helicase